MVASYGSGWADFAFAPAEVLNSTRIDPPAGIVPDVGEISSQFVGFCEVQWISSLADNCIGNTPGKNGPPGKPLKTIVAASSNSNRKRVRTEGPGEGAYFQLLLRTPINTIAAIAA